MEWKKIFFNNLIKHRWQASTIVINLFLFFSTVMASSSVSKRIALKCHMINIDKSQLRIV
jgi:hypothetical protein